MSAQLTEPTRCALGILQYNILILVKKVETINGVTVLGRINEFIFSLQLNMVDNGSIGTQELRFWWLCLNSTGSGIFAVSFITKKIEILNVHDRSPVAFLLITSALIEGFYVTLIC